MLLQETGPLWYHWLLLAAAAALAVFAWVKALKAGRKRRERLRREGELWQRDARLREEYRLLTEEKLRTADDEDLLRGVGSSLLLFCRPHMLQQAQQLPVRKRTSQYHGKHHRMHDGPA